MSNRLLHTRAFRSGRILLTAVAIALLAACAKREEAWQEAVRTDTPDAYERFLERNPGSPRAAEARTRRDALIDERDWSVAKRKNSAEAYVAYLEAHADGIWSELAKRRLDALKLGGPKGSDATKAPPVPARTSSGASAAPATSDAPVASAAPVLPAAPAATVYVQLGAFSSAASAKKSWTRLQRSFAELQSRKPAIDESPIRGSKLYRLRLGLASLEEASLVCAALTRGGAECLLPESR